MKKKTLLALSLCVISIASARKGEALGVRGKVLGDSSPITYLLPPVVGDSSELDARDTQNRPLRTAAAIQQLDRLFRENLVQLTVFADLHALAETVAWINSISHLFNGLFLSRLTDASEALLAALLNPFRRFVHNVDKLWITFSVGSFSKFLSPSQNPLSQAPLQVPLRI